MVTETYSIGSIADLITGKSTPNKPKIVAKELEKPQRPIVEQQELPQKIKKKKAVEKAPAVNAKQNKAIPPPGKQRKRKHSEHEHVESQEAEATPKKHEHVESQEAEVPPKKKQSNTVNGERRIKMKENEEKEKMLSNRTLFVGNIPIQMSKVKLRKFFSKYGNVEAVRVRGVPVADVRVPKKVAYIKKEFHPDRTSANCYVRFSTPEEAQNALVLNGEILKEHHLRVRLCDEEKKPDSNKAIFIGNVSFSAEEDDIWKLFEPCGKIESVRLIRDSKTGIGKGFGYVNFESSDSVELAMQMEKFELKGRQLRVSVCKTNARKKKEKHGVQKFRKTEGQEGNESTAQKKDKRKIKIKQKQKENLDENQSKTTNVKNSGKSTKTQGFEGIKISEKKKKRKINKGLLQKKKLVKKLLPQAKP